MLKLIASVAGLMLAVCATAEAQSVDLVRELAPGGRLRAAINFGNPILAQRNPATGAPGGVSVALARELGRQLGVPVDLVYFDEAGQVFAALSRGEWDVAFLAIDPKRAGSIDFTPPYVLLEATYLVPAASPIRSIAEVDRDGVRIAVAEGSAYDLYLSHALGHATLVRAETTAAAFELLRQNRVDALAGIRQPLDDYARGHPEARMLDGRFMEIPQAMGVPTGRPAGLRFLRAFVEEMKASGFIAMALGMSGQADALLAPPEQP